VSSAAQQLLETSATAKLEENFILIVRKRRRCQEVMKGDGDGGCETEKEVGVRERWLTGKNKTICRPEQKRTNDTY
jgi:hypothetical protein